MIREGINSGDGGEYSFDTLIKVINRAWWSLSCEHESLRSIRVFETNTLSFLFATRWGKNKENKCLQRDRRIMELRTISRNWPLMSLR